MRKQTKQQAGFTLVELAISMVIITLLTAAVIGGKELIEAARTRSIVAEIEGFQTAFNSFTEKYKAYPGDYRLAATKLPGAPTGGNGDTRIQWEVGNEGSLAWLHMQVTGYVGGEFTPGLNAVVGTSIPSSRASDGAGYAIDHDATGEDSELGNHLLLGQADGSGINNNPVLTGVDAQAIDSKIDDGQPNAGIMEAAPKAANDCMTSAAADADYELDNDVISCYLKYKLD